MSCSPLVQQLTVTVSQSLEISISMDLEILSKCTLVEIHSYRVILGISSLCFLVEIHAQNTVRAEIFAVVLFSQISRVKLSRKFQLQFMSIYSSDNISKIAKLTTRKLPHLAKTAKITVRENNGVYSSGIHSQEKIKCSTTLK